MSESAHVHMESVSTPHVAHVFMPERVRPSLGQHDPCTWVFTCICKNNTCNVVLLYFVFVPIFGAPLTHVSNFPQSPPSSHVSYAHPLLAYLTLIYPLAYILAYFSISIREVLSLAHRVPLELREKWSKFIFFLRRGVWRFSNPNPHRYWPY